MTTHHLTDVTPAGSPVKIYHSRYVPRTKPEAERNRSQEEARRWRLALRPLERFQTALAELEATGEKAAEAMRALVSEPIERAARSRGASSHA